MSKDLVLAFAYTDVQKIPLRAGTPIVVSSAVQGGFKFQGMMLSFSLNLFITPRI